MPDRFQGSELGGSNRIQSSYWTQSCPSDQIGYNHNQFDSADLMEVDLTQVDLMGSVGLILILLNPIVSITSKRMHSDSIGFNWFVVIRWLELDSLGVNWICWIQLY